MSYSNINMEENHFTHHLKNFTTSYLHNEAIPNQYKEVLPLDEDENCEYQVKENRILFSDIQNLNRV